jgi:hypothetical protein
MTTMILDNQPLVSKRMTVPGKAHPILQCPVEGCDVQRTTLQGIARHGQVMHGVTVVGAYGPPGSYNTVGRRRYAEDAPAVITGDDITIGPRPEAPVCITVENGTSRRRVLTYMLPMADVVDAIAGALRQAIDVGQGVRRR